jgi:hypothetical protein
MPHQTQFCAKIPDNQSILLTLWSSACPQTDINIQNNTMKRSVPHQFRTGFFKSKAPRRRKLSSAQVTGTNAVSLLLVQVPG